VRKTLVIPSSLIRAWPLAVAATGAEEDSAGVMVRVRRADGMEDKLFRSAINVGGKNTATTDRVSGKSVN
jgi:hypothetical protein